MIILISEFIQCDIGHKYRWSQGIVEIFGSWNNWTHGTRLNLGVVSGKFFVFGEIDIPEAIHEYKYRFRGECSFGICDEWFHDNSGRMIYNNNQIIDNRRYNYVTYLKSYQRVPLKEANEISLIDGNIYHNNLIHMSWYIRYIRGDKVSDIVKRFIGELPNYDILFPFLKIILDNIPLKCHFALESYRRPQDIRSLLLLNDKTIIHTYNNNKVRRFSDPDVYDVDYLFYHNEPSLMIDFIKRKCIHNINKIIFKDSLPKDIIDQINKYF